MTYPEELYRRAYGAAQRLDFIVVLLVTLVSLGSVIGIIILVTAATGTSNHHDHLVYYSLVAAIAFGWLQSLLVLFMGGAVARYIQARSADEME